MAESRINMDERYELNGPEQDGKGLESRKDLFRRLLSTIKLSALRTSVIKG